MSFSNTWLRTAGLALLLSAGALAQIRSGVITGAVMDAGGGAIPNITVEVTNRDTGVKNNTKTTDAGDYTIPYLQAGVYELNIAAPGFTPYRQTGINVEIGQTVRVNVLLRIGDVQSTIEVSAQSQQIQTDSATVQASVQQDLIEAIPNPDQNPLYYAMLQSGVVPRNATADTTSVNSFGIGVNGRREFSAVGVNGGRAFTNDIQLDGLPVMGGGYNEASVVPNTEGLQEVKVIANDFSAEYGHGQAVLSLNTKSGTNAFHGQADYNIRNEALNANSNSNNANGISRPAFKVDEFGGAVGGPIRKNKLFFFTSYHYLFHNRGATSLLTVPTDAERKGDFSHTFIRDSSGQPVAAQIFDPFHVTQVGTNLYQRAIIPNAIIPNPDPFALKMYSFYPEPNRTPDDAFNTNNYKATIVTGIRRHSLNDRIDYKRDAHSIYGSGGISYATVTTPRAFGTKGFNDAPALTQDKNPYGQIGDTWVISPTLILDARFGFNRINTETFSGNKSGFTDYAGFGVPANIMPLFAISGAAPIVAPNGLSGGSGGGSNWAALSDGTFGNKHERQSSFNANSSITKIHGRWTHKAGVEFRNLLSNYQDLEEASAQIPSTFFQSGGNFNFQYVTASGGVASQNTSNNQLGVNGAALLLGAGLWWIRPGANVQPAFSQKYFAAYSQNDWKITNRLTLNLGLRWDLQPGPTERYNRMSGVDLTAKNDFGSQGAIAFPNVGGYSRNLWNTEYTDFGPRLGAAWQANSATVIRGGYGISYLPTNTGYFSGPTDYGTSQFSSGTQQLPYGTNPIGVPAGRFSDPVPLAIAAGANPMAPINYGISEAKFDRFLRNGRAQQWNIFVERTFAKSWLTSVGYSASHSDRLENRQFAIDSIQQIPADTLAAWKAQYIASNGVTNPSNVQVPNPFQPKTGPLLGFTGILGGATIPQVNTLYPYPLLAGAGVNQSRAWANYNSLQARLSHAFAAGLHLDMNYTWSKSSDNTDTVEDNQGFNAGGTAGNLDVTNLKNNYHLGFNDIPHRFVTTFLYQLPFGEGKQLDVHNRFLRAIVGNWQTGGAFIAQSGFPFAISGDNSGAAYGHPDAVQGAPLEVPAALQRWYDGKTSVTLPDGRVITPTKNTFLKYYEGAFRGRVLTTPNGSVVPDVFWYGTVANTLDGLRNFGRINLDLSLRRTFRVTERISLDVAADATNLLNHTELSGSFNGALGGTNTVTNASRGLLPGMGTSDTYGTIGVTAFDPRQVTLNAKIRF